MDEQMIAPCPFCNAAPEDCPQNSERPHPQRKGEWCVYIWCDNCNARGPEKREAAEAIAAWNSRAAHGVMAGRIAELEAEVERLKGLLNNARAASKRRGRDLLREEADAALSSFRTEWEPLRCVADRAGAQSASWLVSRARDLQRRGLVESRWIGNDRTSSLKVWRTSVPAALAPHPERRSERHE